jgi:DNA-binding CsgD family transcriptional regulator/energy-coupling factor transporter ATP-binding protein EcfA2
LVTDVSATFGLWGRDDVLRFVTGVLAGGGSAVAVGDPGAGKSTLLKVADQLAQRQGRRVLSVAPTQFDRGLPFAGLVELISQCPDGAEEGLPGPQQRALAVALRRVEPAGDVDALAVPIAVRGLLTNLCEAERVAIIIDDLQWLDQASAGSLSFALRRISIDPDRICVMVGTRPEGAGADLIRGLPEPRNEFSLQPLEEWAIGQLLRERLGPRWTPPMSAGVARASGGNPFLALMIANAMQADLPSRYGSVRQRHDAVFPVPPSLAELLRERVTRLPQPAREVLLLVSAAGQLTMAQLQGIVEATVLRPALEAAADADVATVGAQSAVTFTHPLLASAVYDAAQPEDRRHAHRVLAEALEDPVERARHRARSMTSPDEAIAAELEEAANVSRDRGAQGLAGELLEGAALATPPGASGAASLGRWLRAVDCYIAAGDGVAAQAALDMGSPLAAVPEQQAQLLVRRLKLVDHYSGVRSIAEEAVRLAPQGSEVRAEILTILGLLHRMQGHGDEALQVTRMAVREAAAVHRVDVQLEALNHRLAAEWHWAEGDPEQTLREIERLVESAALNPTAMYVVWTKGFFAVWNDVKAESHVRDGIMAAVKDGRYGDLSYLHICLVLILIRASRVRDAQAAMEESDRLGAWAGSSLQEAMARILVKEYAGDLDGARELARNAAEQSRVSGSTYWLAGFMAQVGFIETSARNWHTALEVTRELADIFASTKMVDLEQLLWGVDYADAALHVGAMQDVEAAISVLRRQGLAGRPEATVAAERCQALMQAALGDVESALSELGKIVDQPGVECPFEAARSRLALGQVYRRAGHKAMASETLSAAARAFDELGIPRWAERARDEAGRVGLHPTTSTLTETERRVAELVGSGHSNLETAAELFMSVKSVEANLTRIYRKLSVRSRTELANHLHDLDSASNSTP